MCLQDFLGCNWSFPHQKMLQTTGLGQGHLSTLPIAYQHFLVIFLLKEGSEKSQKKRKKAKKEEPIVPSAQGAGTNISRSIYIFKSVDMPPPERVTNCSKLHLLLFYCNLSLSRDISLAKRKGWSPPISHPPSSSVLALSWHKPFAAFYITSLV